MDLNGNTPPSYEYINHDFVGDICLVNISDDDDCVGAFVWLTYQMTFRTVCWFLLLCISNPSTVSLTGVKILSLAVKKIYFLVGNWL